MGFPFQSRFFKRGPPGARLVRGVNVKRGTTEWGEDARFWSDLKPDLALYELRVGDVVIGMDGSRLGENFAVIRDSDLPALLVQRVTRLRARDGMDQGFLRYLVCNPSFTSYIKAVHTGTAIPHVSGGQIARFPVRIPILAEQRAIARVLGSLDDKIELNRRMNQTLEDICRALFKFWFVDFGPVRAKQEGRWKKGESLPGMPADMWDLWPSELEESEIGEIPKGWKASSLSRLFLNWPDCVLTGPFGSNLHSSDYRSEGTPLLLVKNVLYGAILEENLPLVGSHKLEDLSRYLLREGDIVFTRVGAVGRSAYVHARYAGWMISGQTLRVRIPNRAILNSRYLSQAYAEASFIGMVESHALGTTRPSLNTSMLESFEFLLPSIGIQEAFACFAKPMDDMRMKNLAETDSLTATRDALLPKLLSGEIRVKVDA